MKKIWLAPIFIAIALVFVLAAYLFNSMRATGFAKETSPVVLPNSYGNSAGKPSSGYNSLKSPAVASANSDLETDLNSVIDDGGVSDFSDLQKDASTL